LHQPDRQHDEQQELQILGLPVFRDVDGEAGGGDVLPEADFFEAGGDLPLIEIRHSGESLPGQREQEQQPERDAQAVGNERIVFHRASTPMANI
jgi:hypothetical protein